MRLRRGFYDISNRLVHIPSLRLGVDGEKIIHPNAALTLGNGEPGAKTRRYREYCALIDESCKDKLPPLDLLPNIALTPSLWMPFINRSGASREESNKAEEAIFGTPFTSEERAFLSYANYLLRPDKQKSDGIITAWRSDEPTAAGCGLWKGSIVLNDGSSESLAQTERAMKTILASEFSLDVTAFKRRVGLPMGIPPGALVMPTVCDVFPELMVAATIFHINAILNFYGPGEHIAIVGPGIGGANVHSPYVFRFNEHSISKFSHSFSSFTDLNFQPDGLFPLFGQKIDLEAPSLVHSKSLQRLSTYIGNVKRLFVERLVELAKSIQEPTYLEIALDFYRVNPLHFSLLQASPLTSKPFNKPDVPDSQKIIKLYDPDSINVVGQGALNSKTIYKYEYDGDRQDMIDALTGKFKFPKGSVLFVNDAPQNFFKHFHFRTYADVAAIIFANPSKSDVGGQNFLMSHFNGAIREAGIIVMRGDVNEYFFRSLPANKEVQKKMVVYADDSKGEAFAATC